jgi:hypothetical protein
MAGLDATGKDAPAGAAGCEAALIGCCDAELTGAGEALPVAGLGAYGRVAASVAGTCWTAAGVGARTGFARRTMAASRVAQTKMTHRATGNLLRDLATCPI